MGRRKKVDSTPLSMASIASEEAIDNDSVEEANELEAMAGEEAESLEVEADAEAEAEEAKPAPKPRRRRNRKKAEPMVEVSPENTPEQATAPVAPATPAPIVTAAMTPAPQLAPLPPVESVPLALTETAISSRVLNQMTRQIDATAAAQDPNQLVKQLTAVKEISVSICSQLDRMTATLIELQNKHAAAIQELQKEKATPRKAKIPTWLAATSAIALTLSIVSVSLTQATRHTLLSAPNANIPSHLLTGLAKPAFAAEPTSPETKLAPALPGPRANMKAPPAIAKKESGASRRGKR